MKIDLEKVRKCSEEIWDFNKKIEDLVRIGKQLEKFGLTLTVDQKECLKKQIISTKVALRAKVDELPGK